MTKLFEKDVHCYTRPYICASKLYKVGVMCTCTKSPMCTSPAWLSVSVYSASNVCQLLIYLDRSHKHYITKTALATTGVPFWLAVHGKPVLFWKGNSGLKFPCFLFMHANGTGPFKIRAVPIV